jgi:hypothetical protein
LFYRIHPVAACNTDTTPGFEPMTLWLRVQHPNHSATMTLHIQFPPRANTMENGALFF